VHDETEIALEGGWQSDARRVGDVVLRSAKPQSRTVIALLRHLESAGFDASPRPIGDGFTSDGREQLAYIDGESPHPGAWSEEVAWELGAMLGRLHRATATFAPPTDAVWRPWFARDLLGSRPVIGHGDLGPWNVLARDGMPVAIIDWDYAGPVDAVWELAQLVWLNAQLHDDDVAAVNGLPSPEDRARLAAAILDGYGLPGADRAGFVDRLVEFAIRSAREEATEYRVEHDTVSPAPDGFPILWGITWRARSAAWMLDHRELIVAAIT
jgi:hypothetical protein